MPYLIFGFSYSVISLSSLLISANLGEGRIDDDQSGNYESIECHGVHFSKSQGFQVPNSTSINDWEGLIFYTMQAINVVSILSVFYVFIDYTVLKSTSILNFIGYFYLLTRLSVSVSVCLCVCV